MDEFEITEDHLKLVRAMEMGWDDSEFGAPGIDSKRPYGNSTVYYDIAEILEIEPEEDGFSSDQESFMFDVWQDTQIVLQILIDNLDTGIKAGNVYTKDEETDKWVLSKD
jgi:hypothetical protein